MNAFLHARTAFGFEYLISSRAEHSDADRDITGIEGLLFLNRLTRNLQKFSSDDGNESLQSPSPSLTGFNIQASVMKIVTSESWESL